MTRDKFFAKSLTLWGAVVAFLPGLFAFLGMETPPELPQITESVVGMADAINEVVGLVMIVWGRWRADSSLTMRKA